MSSHPVHPSLRPVAPSAQAMVMTLVLASVVACSGGKPATADSTRTGTSDLASRPHDVSLTPAQRARVRIATVSVAAFRPDIITTGTVAFNGDRSTPVLAPVSGPITRILVALGAHVRKGEALAMVTSPDFATAIAGYRKAQSAYRNMQRIADLNAQLFKNDAISRREVDQASTDAAGAAADRDAAIEQMRALGVDDGTINAIRENRSGASATAAVIRAPIEGTVVERLVSPGQLIQAGTTAAFTIADLSSVWVLANVFESDLGLVAAGEGATITTGAYPTPIAGQVAYVGSFVDPGSKATAVRVTSPNPRGILKRDMLVNVSIRAAQSRNALLIPTAAVLRDDQSLPFSYVALPNGQFGRRQLTLGARSGDVYEVKSGLNAGEHIVVDGALFLQFAGSQ